MHFPMPLLLLTAALMLFSEKANGQNWPMDSEKAGCQINAFERPFSIPEMNRLPNSPLPFEYIDVGAEIPNYLPADRWGEQGEPQSSMQMPLPPEQAISRISVPKGFRVELYASEPDLQGKPISMSWDERGRLWIAETVDYPNQLQPPGKGNDRIRIVEDTDGDGRADRFIVFAEHLSIPTGIVFSRDGVIVQDGTETIYLRDTDGDDVADERTTLVTGWNMADTHGGVSNLRYGLDNWIWAMQGYNASQPVARGVAQQPFRMGFFRMLPDGSHVEFLRSTTNNTWGLGLSEEGLVFGSTANGSPSVYMPIPNRYYERVMGWTSSLTLHSIADSNRFLPITDRIRQVDHFGGYTAAAGHSLYTARQYPTEFWNRIAFVCEPTGHLVAGFVLSQSGCGFRATNPFNLFASDDEWSAPIMAEVGPDGNVWVIDWYNYIVQHNPTPKGFETGQGNAYETKLRDKRYGRIYRVVNEAAAPISVPDFRRASAQQLVAALGHSVMLVRLHAQRLLVERGRSDVAEALIELIHNRECDPIGLNVAAIHALWTLHGLGLIDEATSAEPTRTGRHETVASVIEAVYSGLQHPSAGVRRNAAAVLPKSDQATDRLLTSQLHLDQDPNVRLAALLALADQEPSMKIGQAMLESLSHQVTEEDRWLTDAITCGAANNDLEFLIAATQAELWNDSIGAVVRIVAEHFARKRSAERLPELLHRCSTANSKAIEQLASGLSAGWPQDCPVKLSSVEESRLIAMAENSPAAIRSALAGLAKRWGTECLSGIADGLIQELIERLESVKVTDEERIAAATSVLALRPDDLSLVEKLLDSINPRFSPELSRGLIECLESSSLDSMGELLVSRLSTFPPSARAAAVNFLLQKSSLTLTLLDSLDRGEVSLGELALDQRQSLSRHPDFKIRRKAKQIFDRGGSLPSPDRAEVLKEYMAQSLRQGDTGRGKELFIQHCSKCHLHSGQGAQVGPDLTGMSVHPKEEMLIHILDPNRSVENNFRAYSLLTIDGLVLTGMLAAESRTSVELFDTEGKRRVVLREDIEQLSALPQSIMPEGFEKMISPEQMADLLEFLAKPPRFWPLDISTVATVATDRGMFLERDGPERMIFADWSDKTFNGVPFRLIKPEQGKVNNAILLHSPLGAVAKTMPPSVTVECKTIPKAIHLLGGVAGWGYPLGQHAEPSLLIRLIYENGEVEEHQLLNGIHIADYIRRIDVPGSEFAFGLGEQQLRYLSIQPKQRSPLSQIEFVKGQGDAAPLVMAVTVESHQN